MVSRVIGLYTYTGELVLESPADVRVVNPTGTATVVTASVPLVVTHCQCHVLSAYVRLSTIIVPAREVNDFLFTVVADLKWSVIIEI